MYKQQQYDQGVQKIQGYIDNIAGMDVIHDADKTYLQSKLNDLGSKLKTVAAGDFSNQQLVNSVGGMAGQIIKDPSIQNAVYSTAWLKKQNQLIQEDEQKGISNPYNTAEFNEATQKYLNSPVAGQKFTASYFKPRDVWKKLTDVAEKVGVDSNIVKQLFKTDAAGNPITKKVPTFNSKGQKIGEKEEPEWNPIVATEKLKGKDAGKILTAFQNALDAGDYKQLAINGKWSKQNETPQQLKEQIIDNTKDQINFTSAKVEAIKIALYNEQQKNDKDEDKISLLKQQLEGFKKSLTNLTSSRDTNLALIDSNPNDPDYLNKLNSIRSSLYTNNFLHSAAVELSSKDKEIDYSVSPMFTVTMETNRFNREVQQDKIRNAQWQMSHNLAVQVASDKKLQDQIENYYKYGIGTLPPGMQRTDAVKEPIDINKDPFFLKHSVEDALSNSVKELNDINSKLTFKWFKNANPGASDEAIRKAIYNFSSGNKESIDSGSGDINTYTNRFAAKQLEQWKNNPNSVPAEFRGLIAKQDQLLKDVTIQKNRIEAIKSEAYKIAKQEGLDIPSEADIKKVIKPTKVILNNGQTVNLTAADVTDFANLHPETYNSFGILTVDKNQESLKNQAQKRLSLKFGNLFGAINNSLFTTGFPGDGSISYTAGLSPTSPALGPVPLNKEVKDAIQFINKSKYGALAKIESKLYLESGMIKQPISMPIYRGKENRDDVNAKISAIIGSYETGVNETPGFNKEEMQALLLKDGTVAKTTIIPAVNDYEPNKYLLTLTDKTTGTSKSVTISEDNHLFLQGQKFENKPLPNVLKQINMKGTTNLSGTENPNTTWFNADDFKNLKGVDYKITSDLVKDENNPNNLWMKLYLHNPNGTISNITFPTPIPKILPDGTTNQSLDILPLGINDAVIQQIKSKNNQ